MPPQHDRSATRKRKHSPITPTEAAHKKAKNNVNAEILALPDFSTSSESGLPLVSPPENVGTQSSPLGSFPGGQLRDNVAHHLQDPTTGNRIFQANALGVVQRFSLLHHLKVPSFTIVGDMNHRFVCTVSYPPGGPFKREVTGTSCASEELAKQSACFEVCRKLYRRGLLDHTLFPQCTPTTLVADNTNEPSKTAKNVHLFPKKPALFWASALHASPNRLYPTIVSVEATDHSTYGRFALLTRRPLPPLLAFGVFDSGHKAEVRFEQGAPFKPDTKQRTLLHEYSLRIIRSVTNKPFDASPETLQYLIAPLHYSDETPVSATSQWRFPGVADIIPWQLVELAAQQWKVPLLSADGVLVSLDQDAIIQDRAVEFTNRHFLKKVRYDITPNSPVDEAESEGFRTYVDRCKARVKGFVSLKYDEQPMLEVELVPALNNALNPFSRPPVKSSPRYLIPELCHKFVIPSSTFRSMLLLPSIMHRVDQILLVKELNNVFFGNEVAEQHLLAAVSPTSALCEVNYERLELLGDAFLKLVSSTHCYIEMPLGRESELHGARQRIVSNKSLYVAALDAHLPPFIQSKPFVPKIWQPILHSLEDNSTASSQVVGSSEGSGASDLKQSKRRKQKEARFVQWLSEKTIADVVEAIIGAAYLTGSNDIAVKAAKALQVSLGGLNSWSDLKVPLHSISGELQALLPQAAHSIERLTGFRPIQPAVLAQALTHPSSQSGTIKSYEQLEFLGDAILDFLTTKYIFHSYPSLPPGGMSMLKAAMVSNATLATISVLKGVHHYMCHASPDLSRAFTTFEKELHASELKEKTKAQEEGRPPGQYWLELAPSKALSDIVESVLGAVYLSGRFSMASVETFFENMLRPFYDAHIQFQTLSHHPNKTLFDFLHKVGCQQHEMVKVVENQGVRCNVVIHGSALASAINASSNIAVRKAATTALEMLQNNADDFLRLCNCKSLQTGKNHTSEIQWGYEEV